MEQRVDWMVMSCEARKSKNFFTFAPLQDVSGPGLQFAAHTVENHMIFWRNASWNLDKYTLQRQQKLFDFSTVTRYVWAWSAGLNPFSQKLKILSYFGQKIHFLIVVQIQPSTYYYQRKFWLPFASLQNMSGLGLPARKQTLPQLIDHRAVIQAEYRCMVGTSITLWTNTPCSSDKYNLDLEQILLPELLEYRVWMGGGSGRV